MCWIPTQTQYVGHFSSVIRNWIKLTWIHFCLLCINNLFLLLWSRKSSNEPTFTTTHNLKWCLIFKLVKHKAEHSLNNIDFYGKPILQTQVATYNWVGGKDGNISTGKESMNYMSLLWLRLEYMVPPKNV